MTTLSPGDRVTTIIGGRKEGGTVVYVRGDSVRVALPGRTVTRPIARVKLERVKALAPTVLDFANKAVVAGHLDVAGYIDAVRTNTLPVDLPWDRVLRPVPKPPKPDRDKTYRAFVRTRDCAECGFVKADVAHHHGPRGMGEKCSDYLTVPLCNAHHREFHDTGTCDGKDRARLDAEWASIQLATLAQWSRESGIDATTVMRDALVEAIRRTK